MTDRECEPHPGLDPRWLPEQRWRSGRRTFRAIDVPDLEFLRTWRNDQQSVLRQQEPLTPDHQERWFRNVVEPSYSERWPSALLVVATEEGEPVSYGGLTNIEWTSRRAELSFLAATDRATDSRLYRDEFTLFLRWVIEMTFDELQLHRLFTETWEFRHEHIGVLERCGFHVEGTMRDHVVKDGQFHDALLHGLLAGDRRTT